MTGAAATAVIANVTWQRLRRGRTLYIGAAIAALPVLFALIARHRSGIVSDLYGFEVIVIAVLAAMFVGATIGDEIEERTLTYLWSRPLPRWAVLAGKLAVVMPAVLLIASASWLAAGTLAATDPPPPMTFVALGLGTVTIALLATAITTLAPKHGMALTIVYLLFFDTPAGLMPVSIRYGAITEQVRLASGVFGEAGAIAAGVAGLVITASLCALVAAWRVRKLEA